MAPAMSWLVLVGGENPCQPPLWFNSQFSLKSVNKLKVNSGIAEKAAPYPHTRPCEFSEHH